MDIKLTLRLEKKIIERIKIYAMKHNLSVSGLTENLYRQVLQSEGGNFKAKFGPIAQKYKGIIKNKDLDTENVKLTYLREKHFE
jgi:hypothetical protein